jgi:hypothetical protein
MLKLKIHSGFHDLFLNNTQEQQLQMWNIKINNQPF